MRSDRNKVSIVLCFMAIFLLANCAPTRGIKPGDTQIVAQWLLDKNASEFSLVDFSLEKTVEKACKDICFLDGNDIGSGTYNLFLYTADVPATVNLLVALDQQHQIRRGLRIGVAKYKNEKRTDWTYEPVYPKGLRQFDIMYRPSG